MVQILLNCARVNILHQHNISSLLSIALRFSFTSQKKLCTNNSSSSMSNSLSEDVKLIDPAIDLVPKIPEPPTTCCMSGCANCVWIEYAEKLTTFFKDGGEQAQKHILENVTDSNLRAFLMMELRTMNLK